MQNIAESKEPGDYDIYLDESTNPDGLVILIDGQALNAHIFLRKLPYGSFLLQVQVLRGPSKYEYEPFVIVLTSMCDFYNVYTSIPLTVSWIRTCARAEFHKNFRTFAVSSDKYGSIVFFLFTFSPVAVNIYNPEWDSTKWSEFPNLQGIELLYRRVGDSEWRHALDTDSARISFETIVPEV